MRRFLLRLLLLSWQLSAREHRISSPKTQFDLARVTVKSFCVWGLGVRRDDANFWTETSMPQSEE